MENAFQIIVKQLNAQLVKNVRMENVYLILALTYYVHLVLVKMGNALLLLLIYVKELIVPSVIFVNLEDVLFRSLYATIIKKNVYRDISVKINNVFKIHVIMFSA